MSRRRDLGSMFDEVGSEHSADPFESGKRLAATDEPLLNNEARQMLEERSRAAKEAAGVAAATAAEKGKEFGKAALLAIDRIREEHKRRAQAKAETKATFKKGRALLEDVTPEEVSAALAVQEEPSREPKPVLIYDGMGQFPPEANHLIASPNVGGSVERRADRSVPARIEAPAKKRSYTYVWIADSLLVLFVAGGSTYWWNSQSASEPISPPAFPAVRPTELAPAPVAEALVAAPVPVQAPALSPVEEVLASQVELKPESIDRYASKAQSPSEIVAPMSAPKPRPKKVEPVPALVAPAKEEQQIEQIRMFQKQLESMREG